MWKIEENKNKQCYFQSDLSINPTLGEYHKTHDQDISKKKLKREHSKVNYEIKKKSHLPALVKN